MGGYGVAGELNLPGLFLGAVSRVDVATEFVDIIFRILRASRDMDTFTPGTVSRHDCRDAGGRAMQEQLPRDVGARAPHGRA